MSFSSSSSDHPWIHDVFINFRGEDTRSTFVSHLYAALSNAGIYTFLDDEELKKGENLGPALKRAIEGSHIAIVVFSVNYAESTWCLNELLSSWRKALTQVAHISGWDANNFRTEGELIQEIVADILEKLDISLLSITEFPVGLESHVQQFTKFIHDQSRKVCMIGIWGMGGSGKTTIAKAIYNRIHRRFKGRTSFIESIREVCDNNSKEIIHLQEQLLSDILKIQQKIHSIALGITKIKTRLRGQEAFIVLDDVTKSEQLKALCPNPKLFRSGTVIIITTRDARLLKSLGAEHVFTMTEMDENQSLELFSLHAFRQLSPREDFSELSRNVVAYCGGLPLALEVLGSYLTGRTEQEWRSALSKLEKIPNDQVQQKLRISYDGLEDHMIKDIFLDICCFFIGENRADVTEILNGCGLHADIGIAVLIERSLIKVEKNSRNKIQMHDLLRDMEEQLSVKVQQKSLQSIVDCGFVRM
ncbi:hypothetical protein TSUD_354850 [Trifolium subterraneum]|uniref:TIR domain-containing protein n=1 Tax=Trifolium subterraneum TaxID=3900 RepID=A0A2Z6N3V1_TRISU|nr:hypothetical protein TSUD_354850 [Trifolium subterraneum]